MFKKLRTNYNMSFLKELLLEKGKKCWEAEVDSWGYHLEDSYGYGFYTRSYGNKIKIKGNCSVNLTLEAGCENDKLVWKYMNIEIAAVARHLNEFYILNIRLKDYKTYATIKLISQGYDYEGEIDNNTLNEFVKIVKEMYDNSFVEWECIPKAKSSFALL